MPDWTYHTLIKPTFKKLSKKTRYGFGLRTLHFLGSTKFGQNSIDLMGHMSPPPDLEWDLNGHLFRSRVWLGPSIDPQGEALLAFSKFGFGAAEVIGWDSPSSKIPLIHVLNSEMIQFAKGYALRDELLKRDLLCVRLDRGATEQLMENFEGPQPSFSLSPHPSLHPSPCSSQASLKEPLVIATLSLEENAEKMDGNLERLQKLGINTIYLEATEHLDSQAALSGDITEALNVLDSHDFSKFSIIVSCGVAEPRNYIEFKRRGVKAVALNRGLVEGGPGLPKRINQYEESCLLRNEVPIEPLPRQSWFWTLLLGISMFGGGLLTFLISKTRVILPYDEIQTGLSREEITEINERILHFMAHDRATLAGTMLSIGIMYCTFSWHGSRRGLYWYKEAILVSALLGFLNFFAFLSYGYLDILHAFVTCCLFQIFIMGVYAKNEGPRKIPPPCLTNSDEWRLALWAQLLFVVQGVGLILAGGVITYFGATTVFVPQDLEFLGMTKAALQAINENMVPLIAHDRCTFGGMLICAGILILLSALWGFEYKQKWLWWTYAVAGLIPYFATLWIHFFIGYTDLIHLLPVYIGIFLLAVSLILSKNYFFGESN